MTMIEKLQPLALTAVWVLGIVSIGKMFLRGSNYMNILQMFIVLCVFSVFVKSPDTFFSFGTKIMDTVSNLTKMFEL